MEPRGRMGTTQVEGPPAGRLYSPLAPSHQYSSQDGAAPSTSGKNQVGADSTKRRMRKLEGEAFLSLPEAGRDKWPLLLRPPII